MIYDAFKDMILSELFYSGHIYVKLLFTEKIAASSEKCYKYFVVWVPGMFLELFYFRSCDREVLALFSSSMVSTEGLFDGRRFDLNDFELNFFILIF